MIATALIAIFITFISPFFGQIYVIGIAGKKLFEKNKFYQYFAVIAIAMISLILTKAVSLIIALNMLMVLLFTPYIFVSIYKKIFNVEAAIAVSGILNGFYGIIMNFIIKRYYSEDIQSVFTTLRASLEENNMNPDQLNLMLNYLNNFEDLFINYISVIWSFFMILAIFFGALIIAKKSDEINWNFSLVRWPFQSVYLLIAGLALTLIPLTNSIGIKLLVLLLTFYFIEGISILTYFWKDYFTKSKFFLVILIIAILFNPFLLLLISLVGVFDIWFNFRKIDITEEE